MKNISIEIFLSASSSPGKFGETVHNAGFKTHKLNFVYKAIKVKKIKLLIDSMKLLKIKGCSISMPFKESVTKYIDSVDPIAKKAGAVNTVVNDGKKLIGYNTDIYAVMATLERLKVNQKNSVLIIGSGGMARATIIALKEKNIKNVFITGRNMARVNYLAKKFKYLPVEDTKKNNFVADILINTTPVGMHLNDNKLPISKNSLTNFKKIIDVVVKEKGTALINEAKRKELPHADGVSITFLQAFKQYEIYTGLKAPAKEMFIAYKTTLNPKRKKIIIWN